VRQYRNAIFYQTEDELQSIEAVWSQHSDSSEVSLERFDNNFKAAELYHQKYRLRRKHFVFQSLLELFDDNEEKLIHSEMATKLSGFVCGFGSEPVFKRYMREFGLSPTKTSHIVK
jgi:hypothetical protein